MSQSPQPPAEKQLADRAKVRSTQIARRHSFDPAQFTIVRLEEPDEIARLLDGFGAREK